MSSHLIITDLLLLPLADLSQDLQGWSSLAVAVLGLPALAGTMLTIIQSRRDAKRARTLDYLGRLFTLDFAPLNTQVVAFLRTGDEKVFAAGASVPPAPSKEPTSIPAAIAAYERLPLQTQAQITLVLNFYEELAGSYRAGLLDDKIAKNMLEPVLTYAWEAASWFIDYRKSGLRSSKGNEAAEEAMCEWESLVKELAAK